MPGLSIGHSTPFAQSSNYHTVLNHRFREESAYDAAKQVKIKCPYCGIWARKGGVCSLCGTRIPGGPAARFQPPSNPQPTTPGRAAANTTTVRTPGRFGSGESSSWGEIPANTMRSRTPPASARNDNQPRDMRRPMSPSTTHHVNYATRSRSKSPPASLTAKRGSLDGGIAARKVKCSYCGIWVQSGRLCTLCRTPAK